MPHKGAGYILGAVIVALSTTGIWQGRAVQANSFDDPDIKKIDITIDRTDGQAGEMTHETRVALEKVLKTRSIYLRLQVLLDGTSPTAVQTRIEESASPDPVPCEPGDYRRLIMGSDMEYIVDVGERQKETYISASIYPGERTEFPYNDVSCIYNSDEKKAVFYVQGFYYVIPNPVPGGFIAQLRPINPPFRIAQKFISQTSGVELKDKKESIKEK